MNSCNQSNPAKRRLGSWARLRWLSLVLVVVALALVVGQCQPWHGPAQDRGSRTLRWYLVRGQWRADARTLVAAARYLLDPELPLAPTNGGAISALPKTNHLPVHVSA